ncbi:unnamed protein product [Prorocentrum cordatum]|uniref:Uncharacterized protein n=1 Tax=Prorocentrum cordatum TaxID=2364126 RepID=A0ABN9SW58_9DINO|nr:unnamed protein product [Polarella glacialis]
MPRGRSPAAASGDAAGAGRQQLPTGRASSGMLRVPSASSVLSSLHEEPGIQVGGGGRLAARLPGAAAAAPHGTRRQHGLAAEFVGPRLPRRRGAGAGAPTEPQTPGSPGRCEQHSALSLRGLALVGALSACGWYGLRLVLRDYIGGRRGGRRELALELHALSTMHALGWLAFILSKLRGPSEELPRYCSRALVASLGFYLHDCWESFAGRCWRTRRCCCTRRRSPPPSLRSCAPRAWPGWGCR